MCGRKALFRSKKKIINELFIDKWNDNFYNSYNIAPTQNSPILIYKKKSRIIYNMRWGLIPKWSINKNIGSKLINARKETLHQKPSFQNLLNKNRCIIICNGFYEWKKINNSSQAYYITQKNNKLLLFAGLWSSIKTNLNNYLYSYTIITKPANSKISKIHNRMPAILNHQNINNWIDCENSSIINALKTLEISETELKFYPISKNINSTKNNFIELLNPIKTNKTLNLFT